MNPPNPPGFPLLLRLARSCRRVETAARDRGRQVGFRLRYALLITSLLWTCNLRQPADLERTQTDNMQLTKTLHDYLNHRDWQGVEGLCAETVRYRGRATHFTEVEETKTLFLARYRTTVARKPPGQLEIRQLYPAGAYHVIVEGITSGELPDTTVAVCLIYTIEHNHITRLYAY